MDVQNVDRHKDLKNKIKALEQLALEREAEVQRLKVEKVCVQEEIARFQKESSEETNMLLWVVVPLLYFQFAKCKTSSDCHLLSVNIR